MVAWQNVLGETSDPAARLALGDLHITQKPVDIHTARMDLVFHLTENWTDGGEVAGIRGRSSSAPTSSTRTPSKR